MTSQVTFLSGGKYVPITQMGHLQLQAASPHAARRGVHFELGLADRWNGEDLMVNGHFLTMNLADRPLHVHIRDERTGEWVPHSLAPGAFWIHPEGGPFSLRLTTRGAWSAAIVNGQYLDQVLGGHHELVEEINVADPLLAALFRAAIAELLDPSPLQALSESLVTSFALALGSRHGRRAAEFPAASALSQAAIDSLLRWIEGRLDARLTVAEMAEHMGLSVAHFAREFKRATGQGPWEYVIERRLQRAAQLLTGGTKVAIAALECGFFDQAHLSRAFKARFAVSPSLFARQAPPAAP